MIRSSLAARLAVAIAALVFLTVVLTTGLAIVTTGRQVSNDTDRFLAERGREITEGERSGPGRGQGRRDIAEQAERFAAESDAFVQAIGKNGQLLGATDVELPVSANDLLLASRGGDASLRTIELDGERYRMITVPVRNGGAVQVARSLEESSSLQILIRDRLLLVGFPLALLGAGLGWLLARRSLRPLSDLSASAERIAATKDLETPIGVDGRDDEIGRLAASFDDMLAALAASRDQQQQLIQDAAHELRTPLTSVTANVDLLSRAPDIPADDRSEILSGVKGELRQLDTLFTEIIELATDDREAAPFEQLDLLDVAHEAADDERRRSPNEIRIVGGSSVVNGDRDALRRAVGNLVGNAVKYSPDAASIEIRVGDGAVAVADNGPGIAPADKDRVFQRFYRSDAARSQPGSGLGLAIVAKIVDAHGGTPFVEDADPGPGAVVGFRLPDVS